MGDVIPLFGSKKKVTKPSGDSTTTDATRTTKTFKLGSGSTKALSLGSSILTAEMDFFLNSLQGVVLRKKIDAQRVVVAQYTDQELCSCVEKSSELDWTSKPAFYRAVSEEIKFRKI